MANPRNSVTLIGRIPNTDKIGYNYKQAQDPKHNSMIGAISVRRAFKKKDEQYYPEDLINIKAFGATADYMNNYVHRGDTVALTGELVKEANWKDQNGQEHYGGLIVRIDSITKVGGSASEGTSAAAPAAAASQAVSAAPENPFAKTAGAAQSNPFLSSASVF